MPDEFEHVKDVPAIFTINKFNFTKVGSKECGCAQPVITDQEEFTIHTLQIFSIFLPLLMADNLWAICNVHVRNFMTILNF